MIDYKKQGKKNRKKGLNFENQVREHMEGRGWIVAKWTNNIDLQYESIIKARTPFIKGRLQSFGTGFPDFIMMYKVKQYYRVIFVECKTNGILKKEEKEKMKILENMGFDCYIAYQNEEEKVEYRKFLDNNKRKKIY